MEKIRSKRNTGMAPEEVSALEKVNAALEAGKPARSVSLTKDEVEAIKPLTLLTMKPVIVLV